MNKLKEGMYVKTTLGYIRRITEVLTTYEVFDVYRVDEEFREGEDYEMTNILYPDDVMKSSGNAIDLIEVGDIIITEYRHRRKPYIEHVSTLLVLEGAKKCIEDGEPKLKGIVTKEQFESIAYKLGDE